MSTGLPLAEEGLLGGPGLRTGKGKQIHLDYINFKILNRCLKIDLE